MGRRGGGRAVIAEAGPTAGGKRAVAALRRHGWPVGIWLVLVASGLLARPLLAPGESELLSRAWWAWLAPEPGGSLIVSLIHLGWLAFGVSETWARLVPPLFALAALLLVGPVARLLWPGQPRVASLAPIVLAGTGAFVAHASLVVADTALLSASLLGLAGVANAWHGRRLVGWGLFAAALFLGLSVAGSTAFVLLLPAPLAAPLWLRRPIDWRFWYLGLAAALTLGVAASLPWLPDEAAGAAAARSWYWYPLLLPLLLYPWVWWTTLRRAVFRYARRLDEDGFRACGWAAVAAMAALAADGTWRADAILPALAPLALAAARLLVAQDSVPKDFHAVVPGLPILVVGLVFFLLNIIPVAHLDAIWRGLAGEEASLPIWLGGSSLASGLALLGGGFVLSQLAPLELPARTVQVALLPVLLAVTLHVEFFVSLGHFFDLAPLAAEMRAVQHEGRPLAIYGGYDGEFDFSGRLEAPPTALADRAAALAWSAANPEGVLASRVRGSLLHLPARPLHIGPAGEDWVALWPAEIVRATEGEVLRRRF